MAVTNWSSRIDGYLGASWREAGLATALIVGAGFLFWRLGKRARHDEREAASAGQFAEEPAYPAEELPFLSHMSIGRGLSGEEPDRPVPRPPRQFATLREALAAMEAERIGLPAGERKQVDA